MFGVSKNANFSFVFSFYLPNVTNSYCFTRKSQRVFDDSSEFRWPPQFAKDKLGLNSKVGPIFFAYLIISILDFYVLRLMFRLFPMCCIPSPSFMDSISPDGIFSMISSGHRLFSFLTILG